VEWAAWERGGHGNVNITIWQSEVGKQVKSTWQNSQIAMWTSQFGKVELRNRTTELGKIAKQMVFHTKHHAMPLVRWVSSKF
jgi:hypothetical protein